MTPEQAQAEHGTDPLVEGVIFGLYRAAAQPDAWTQAMAACADLLDADHGRLTTLTGVVKFDRSVEQDAQNGFTHRLALDLAPAEGSEDVCVFSRGPRRREFGPQERARARAIAPHMRRAINLSEHSLAALAVDRGLGQALDAFSTACLLLSGDGGLLFANAGAEALLRRGDRLRRAGDKLSAADSAATTALAQAIRRVSEPGAGVTELKLPSPVDRVPAVAVLAPVAGPGPARLVCYVVEASPPHAGPDAYGRLMDMFRLTHAETQITLNLIQGLSPRQIAEKRMASVETVRTQLKFVLEKTQSERQAELFRLQPLFGP